LTFNSVLSYVDEKYAESLSAVEVKKLLELEGFKYLVALNLVSALSIVSVSDIVVVRTESLLILSFIEMLC
jgi:hypothetical protein